MSQSKANDMIMEIGSMILSDTNYADHDWQALALVGNLSHGQRRINGYQYFRDGSFVAEIPECDVTYQLKQLREAIKSENGKEWHQCLIHIIKPEMKINIQFDYDDPKRWSPKDIKSLDMSDYAELIKPSM
ncbi:MAG: hypothetical protein P8179_22410 [Candidatus Thiodiazotropha sp.]|jgi:hypothetical protein